MTGLIELGSDKRAMQNNFINVELRSTTCLFLACIFRSQFIPHSKWFRNTEMKMRKGLYLYSDRWVWAEVDITWLVTSSPYLTSNWSMRSFEVQLTAVQILEIHLNHLSLFLPVLFLVTSAKFDIDMIIFSNFLRLFSIFRLILFECKTRFCNVHKAVKA